MGLFGNSKTKEFQNKVADIWNLIASFSYREVPISAKSEIDANYYQLKSIYYQFSNPFDEYYNSYTTFTSPFGDKTSIAEGMYIIYLARGLAYQGERMSIDMHQRIIIEARSFCSSYSGRQKIINEINNS